MPKVMSCTGKQQFKTNKQNISFSQKICCWGVSRCLYIDNSTFFFFLMVSLQDWPVQQEELLCIGS